MLSREKLERLAKLILEESTDESVSLLSSILSKYSDSEVSSLLASALGSVNSKTETNSEKAEIVCDSTEEVTDETTDEHRSTVRKYTPYEEKLDLALEFREECADVDPSFYTTQSAVLETVKKVSKSEEKCENSKVVEEVEV